MLECQTDWSVTRPIPIAKEKYDWYDVRVTLYQLLHF